MTPQQDNVINSENADLLVSAGAGSGKTTVMIARAVKYLTSPNGSVQRLLMITFTKAAASEMRVKMENELQSFLMTTTDPQVANRIKKQLNLLGQADICTVDKFCEKIIAKYFYVLGIDPTFSIIDEAQSSVYVNRAMNLTFEKLIKQNDKDFLRLLECYSDSRNFEQISKLVLLTSEYLNQNPNAEEFENKILSAYDGNIENSKIANMLNDYASNMVDSIRQNISKLKKQAEMIGHQKLVENCDKLLVQISGIKVENNFLQNQKCFFAEIEHPKKLTNKKDLDFQELNDVYGVLNNELKEQIGKIQKLFISNNIDELKKGVALAKQNVVALLKVSRLYMEQFAKIKRDNNQVDFSDLEFFALKILENEDVRNQIKASYDQIYVDEYQDINDIQDSLISSVSTTGNLFLVGDVKQSIYGFRNTKPQIFVDKFNAFLNDGKDRVAEKLNDNFRTDNQVLQFINFIFAKIMTEEVASINYSKEGMLNGGLNFETPENAVCKSCICIVSKDSTREKKEPARGLYSVLGAQACAEEENKYARAEAFIIAQKIFELMHNQKVLYNPRSKKMRPIEYRDITLLVRSRTPYVQSIINCLRELNIPVNGVGGDNIFEEYEVQILHNFLKLLYNTQDDYALLGFLTSPCVGVTMQELADLRLENQVGKFYEIYQKEKQNNSKFAYANELICGARTILQTSTIFDALNYLVDKTNLSYKISKMENGKQRALNIRTFILHFLSHDYNCGLVKYFDYIKKARKKELVAENIRFENAVNVCTMHESKGLEYPIVFVIEAGKGFNPQAMRGACLFSSNFGIGLEAIEEKSKTSTLVRSAILIELEQQQIAEELRLLYVALTRAKNNLFIVGAMDLKNAFESKNKFDILRNKNYLSLVLGSIDDEKLDLLKNGTTKICLNKNKVDEFYVELYEPIEEQTEQTKMQLDNTDKEQIDSKVFQDKLEKCFNFEYPNKNSTEILEKTSITKLMKQDNEEHLNNIEAPVLFNKKEIFIETNPEVGIAFHKAMELMDYNLKSETEVRNHLKKVLTQDEFSLVDCGTITKCVNHFAPMMEGAEVYREKKFFLNIPYNQIVKNSDITDSIIIEGVIDLLIVKNNEATLVDFKTTNITDENKLRQKYKMQLDCYQKAVESALNCRVSKKIIYSFLNQIEILFDK